MEQLILACQYAAQGDISTLGALFHSQRQYFIEVPYASPQSALSIILVFLPESLEPSLYASLIQQLWTREAQELPFEPEKLLMSENDIKRRGQLLLDYIKEQSAQYAWNERLSDQDAKTTWSKAMTRKLDFSTRQLPDCELFIMRNAPQDLVDWSNGIVAVVAKYRSLTHFTDLTSLTEFENLSHQDASTKLLNASRNFDADLGTVLEELVSKYLTFVNDWQALNPWIAQITDLATIEKLSKYPKLTHYVMLTLYRYPDPMDEVSGPTVARIVARLTPLPEKFPYEGDLTSVCQPTTENIQFLSKTVSVATMLKRPIAFVARLSLSGTPENWNSIISNYIAESTESLPTLLKNAEWIRKNVTSQEITLADKFGEQLLIRSLKSDKVKDLKFVEENFADHPKLEEHLLATVYSLIGTAMSWSRRDTHLRHASALLSLLKQETPSSRRAKCLLDAIYETSNYKIELYPGSEARPRDFIEHSSDALEIIHRILESNPKAYKKSLVSLTSIALDLSIAFGETVDSSYTKKVAIKVRCMAVEAALVDSNFKAALDYCEPLKTMQNSTESWTACFQVGKFTSPYWPDPPSSQVLDMQMNILSSALLICPRENVSTVLSVWKTKERQLFESVYASGGLQNASEDSYTPATSSHPSSDLFMPAKSSLSRFARAISSSVSEFTNSGEFGEDEDDDDDDEEEDENEMEDVEENRHSEDSSRVPTPQPNAARKRDQIGKLLVSGLGWAIGANQ